MKTPHPHSEILKAYAEDTSVKIELYYAHLDQWISCSGAACVCSPERKFRIKPAMCSITLQNGTVVSWPEPMRVAPARGVRYWVLNCETAPPALLRWENDAYDIYLLNAGFCHLTEEAAQQHRKAIVLANGGEL